MNVLILVAVLGNLWGTAPQAGADRVMNYIRDSQIMVSVPLKRGGWSEREHLLADEVKLVCGVREHRVRRPFLSDVFAEDAPDVGYAMVSGYAYFLDVRGKDFGRVFVADDVAAQPVFSNNAISASRLKELLVELPGGSLERTVIVESDGYQVVIAEDTSGGLHVTTDGDKWMPYDYFAYKAEYLEIKGAR